MERWMQAGGGRGCRGQLGGHTAAAPWARIDRLVSDCLRLLLAVLRLVLLLLIPLLLFWHCCACTAAPQTHVGSSGYCCCHSTYTTTSTDRCKGLPPFWHSQEM
jgi:hypothetical protein